MLGNDSDPDGDTLTVTQFTIPGVGTTAAGSTATITGVGTLVIETNGDFTFTPATNYNGPVPTATYTISDGNGGTDTADLTFANVTPVNDAPVATNDGPITVTEDTPATGNVLGNDSDPDGDTLTVTQFTIPGVGTTVAGSTATITGVGTLVIQTNGDFTFTPAANYNGPVPTATYTISDGNGGTDTADLSFANVTPVNDAPVATNDGPVSVTEDTPATGNVLGNDSDPDGDTLTVTQFTIPGVGTTAAGSTATITGVGTLVIETNGDFTFTPTPGYNGPVPTATYTISDGNGGTDTANLSFADVGAVNDAPVATNDGPISVTEDTPATGNVLGNDSDPDGDALTVTQFTIPGVGTTAAGSTATITGVGTLVIETNGDFTFTPAANYNGPVPTATYTISDGNGGTDTADLSFANVTPVNDAPVATNDGPITVTEDTPATGNVLGNDSDPDGDALTVTQFTIPGVGTTAAGSTATITGVGTLVIQTNGDFTFTPAANYNGPVPTATYTISDGNGGTDTADLSFANVTPVNDAPVATNDGPVSVTEDTPATGNVLGNDSDPDGDTLTVTQFAIPGVGTTAAGSTATITGVGTLVIETNGDFTFTPVANYNGPVPTATYTISDGNGGTDTADLSFANVTPVNDAPVATNDGPVLVTEDTPATGNVLGNDSDPDGDTLTVTQFTIPGVGTTAAGTTATITGVGTLVIETNGDFTFTPAANYNGPVPTATYTVSDGNGGTDTADLSFANVTPVNDAPVATNDGPVSVTEDTPATGNVLGNDSDPDGDALTVTQFTIPGVGTTAAGSTATITGVGTMVIQTNGDFTFTPAANYNGPVPTATYTISDGNGGTDTADLSFANVTPVNDAPVATNDGPVSVTEDTPATGNVLGNDSDPDGDTLTVTQFTIPGVGTTTAGSTATITGVGTLVIETNGDFTFTPAANYNGPVPTATYTISDGNGGTDTADLSFANVTPVNDAPVATNDGPVSVTEDTPATGNVLGNDSDPDGDTLTVTQFTIPGVGTTTAGSTATITGVGTLVIQTNGDFTFTPAPGYNGPVPTATYAISDGNGGTDTANLSFANVTPVNDAPVATNDGPVSVTEDTPATGNVLGNDSDPDGDTLTVTQFTIPGVGTTAAGSTATITGVGTLVIETNGDFTFTPAANYNGPVPTATYTISDGNGGTDTADLSFANVTPVNDAPVATNDGPVSVTEDTPATGNVLGNDSDPDGDALTVTQFTIPGVGTTAAGSTATITGVGTLVIETNGDFTFTPAANYNGPVPTATYTISDGNGGTDTADLSFANVTPVNDAPVATNDGPISVTEDTPATGNVLGNDSDPDGDTLTVTQFTIPGVGTTTAGSTATITGVGTLVIETNGDFTFTPAANYNGPVPTATYTISDGNGGTDTADLSFANVTPVNDAPVATNDGPISVTEDTPATGNVLGNDSDPDGDTLTVTQFTIPGVGTTAAGSTATITGVGTLVIETNGDFTFTPAAGYNGPVPTATYTISDGNGGTDTANLSFADVGAVNDAPVATDDGPVSVTEDTPATGNVLGNDSDPDGDTLTVTQFTIPGVGTTTAGSTATITGVGTLVIETNGDFTFTPAANYNGPVPTATYTISDGNGGTDTADLSFANVTPVNDAPVATNDGPVSVTEDTPATGNVLGNDSDPDGDALTVTQFTIPGVGTTTAGSTATITGVGTLVIETNGDFTFTPAANYNGPVPTATYTISDGNGGTDTADLSFANVTPVNDAPVATNDGPVSVTEDTPVTGNVLGNDSDPDGDTITVTQFTISGVGTTAAGSTATITGVGTLVIETNGDFTFTPAANYNGPVPTATYTISDGNGGTDTADLSFANVTPINDAPVATNDGPISVTEDTPATGNVLGNDSDPDGDTLTVTQFTIPGVGTTAAGSTATITGVGTLVIETNGDFTFTPATNYNGPVPTATYTISDGNGGTDTADLSFANVTPVNDAPVATNDGPVSVTEDTPATGNVLGNDSDPDGDTLTVTQFTIPGVGTTAAGSTATITGVGTLVIETNGDFTFTPAANYNGPVPTATYTISDGNGGTDTADLSFPTATCQRDACQ